jgi:hypothetical protein
LKDFRKKKLKYKISSRSVQWEASCYAGGRTDGHDEANRPTKQEIWFKDTLEDGAKQAPKHVG